MIGFSRLFLFRSGAVTAAFCLLLTALQADAKPVRTVQGNNSIEIYAKGK